MRIIPLITAVLVTGVMYLAVFERAALLAVARGESGGDVAASTNDTSKAKTMDAASTMVESIGDDAKIGVVVLHSTAQTIDSAVVLRG